MSKKELERRIYELEKWTCKFYKAIKMIQKKSGVELTETNELLDIPPHNPEIFGNRKVPDSWEIIERP